MPKMPPRRNLRSIVYDAIRDREAFDDPTVEDETKEQLARYGALMERLANDAPALDEAAKDHLAMACHHARNWRESLLDAWIGTDDRAVILECRQDIDRITRTEKALGMRYRRQADVDAETAESISIYDLMERETTLVSGSRTAGRAA